MKANLKLNNWFFSFFPKEVGFSV